MAAFTPLHVIAPLSGFLVTLDAEAAAAAARGCWFAAERVVRASLASLLALRKLLPAPLLLSAGTPELLPFSRFCLQPAGPRRRRAGGGGRHGRARARESPYADGDGGITDDGRLRVVLAITHR